MARDRGHPSNGDSVPDLVAGVIGVGSMGRHHARVYTELPGVTLGGVSDADAERAEAIASEYGVSSFDLDSLLENVDVVSVAVPTRYHADTVEQCLRYGVNVLVEKPYVQDHSDGVRLAELARENGLVLQVGHIERFNPATRVLADIVPDLDVVAIDVERLGPPVDRDTDDSVVMDLMVHDIDIVLSLVGSDVTSLAAASNRNSHATVQLEFEDGSMSTLTASRLTQQKVRRLSVTALSCRVNVDFIRQTVEIHRRSYPEFVETDGDIRYRHESVVEHPTVENGEPLKAELSSFIEAVRQGEEPIVTAEDALDVLELARRIESAAFCHEMEARQ